MPTTLTVIDSSGFPDAACYYRICSSELLANGATIPIDRDKIQEVRRLTIDSLLDTILAARLRQNDNVILVVHAREGGISLRLLRGTETRARADALSFLAGTHSSSYLVPVLSLSELQIDTLRRKMRQVQQLGLARLEIRGCKVGLWEETLRATKAFFLANCVGGPVVRNAYLRTQFNKHSNPVDVERISEHRNGRVFDISGGFVGFQTTPRGEHSFDLNNCRATSQEVFNTWVRRFFPVAGNVPEGSICLHGQYVNDSLILPKETAYFQNLREYCGSSRLSLEGLEGL